MTDWIEIGLLAAILVTLLWQIAREWLVPELRQRWTLWRKNHGNH